MKGKGKGMQVDKDCPLQFPDVQPVDLAKDFPKLADVLGRSEEEGILFEEVGSLQADLERLSNVVGKRLRILENEVQVLTNWQEKKDKKAVPGKGGVSQEASSGKRGKVIEQKPSKKFKDSSGKAALPPSLARIKSKSNQPKLPDPEFADSPAEPVKNPKNDFMMRFWSSVEPYCGKVTLEDLKVLEDILKAHEDDSDYMIVPPLGRHYSERWAEEDLAEEQRDESRLNDRKRNSSNNCNSNDPASILKKAESNMEDSPFGPLTQRLVSALLEENISVTIDDSMNDYGESADEASAISPRSLAKQLNIGNPASLEKRIKRELEEQGILEVEEKVEDDPDDEILMEIRQKQQELQALNQQNIMKARQLYRQTMEELSRQELRRKLAAVDNEVLEAYARVERAKQKKKAPTKKERDAVIRCLNEREPLVRALET